LLFTKARTAIAVRLARPNELELKRNIESKRNTLIRFIAIENPHAPNF
jgi:hypothetical protein